MMNIKHTPSPLRDCVAMGGRQEWNRQTDSKALERRVSLERMGKCPWCLNRNVFMVLGPLKFTF